MFDSFINGLTHFMTALHCIIVRLLTTENYKFCQIYGAWKWYLWMKKMKEMFKKEVDQPKSRLKFAVANIFRHYRKL